MPRDLVIGNGEILINFDSELNLRDFFYPYVGLWNHVDGYRNRIGVWVDGRFSWLDASWERHLGYEEDSLVTNVSATSHALGIRLRINDLVHHNTNLYMKRMVVENLDDRPKEVRVFFSHDFRIAETDIGDTAFYNPYLSAMIHHKTRFYFLIRGESAQGGIYQYATGIKAFRGAEGTWRDAEDGYLEMHAIAQGSVDSTISFQMKLGPRGSETLRYWIAAGATLEEVSGINAKLLDTGFETLFGDTQSYWVTWSNHHEIGMANLPMKVESLFQRSLLVIRTQIDSRGAVIAANDSDIMQTARAHYSYMWPRDGALVSSTLDDAGYLDISRRFFDFCQSILSKDYPALMHKYSADGSMGSSWHPWVVDGEPEIPFQEDGTALVVCALWHHYERFRDVEFVRWMYDQFVSRTADFMAGYRDPNTGLPRPSYDLWEERRGVHLYSTCAVYQALISAARFAVMFGDPRAAFFNQAAEEVKAAILKHLYDPELGRFIRTVTYGPKGELIRDKNIDSSLYAVFALGVLPADDIRVVQTMRQILDQLWVKTPVGGLARYHNDYYFQVSSDISSVPGNPWIICTMWLVEWYVALARDRSELEDARKLLEWAADHAMEAGILPEQVHPYTGKPLSVAPLTWSHSSFALAVLKYLEKWRDLGGQAKA